ncbi:hypothetical protein [Flavivirga sp. 57AJ16]|uniref:hypothetical protein n=1 Tax=Flavivirga sp. 57AJ16 TaxID=3025307 RepID=UPI0023669FA5|nr:hypothetical protein [Flavivirga sp. 57AJ16]MDD7887871.1 hypothetical protein [Flavivirga sp. 57AJ16]
MSQNYKFKSLQIAKGDQAQRKTTKDPNTITVFETGDTKTIDFELLDGTRQNFHYSHYITSWMGKENGERIIKIFFATHLVTINGYCLDEIYNHLTTLSVKSIKAHDQRYLNMVEENQPFAIQISIEWKGN